METLEQEYNDAKTQREKTEAVTRQLRLGVSQENIRLNTLLEGIQEAFTGTEEALLFKRVTDLVNLEKLTLDLQVNFKELEKKVETASGFEATILLKQAIQGQNEIKKILTDFITAKTQVLQDEQKMLADLRAYLNRH